MKDLAAFFTAIDVIHFRMAVRAQGGDEAKLEEQQKARNDVLLAYRKNSLRLNMNESLHQQLEKSLNSLMLVRGKTANQDDLAEAVLLARTILKREWEVTKYGPYTMPMVRLKSWWRRRETLSK